MTHVPGNYPAKIVDFGLMKSSAGLPMAAVMFEYKMADGGGTQRITWFGSFKDGARPYTVDTLVRMGFAGKNGAELAKGNGSGVLDQTKELEIVVGNEEYQGKTRARVKFVNIPGGGAFKEKMADGEAAVLMGGLNLEADFMEARSHVSAPKPAAPVATQPSFTEDDLPF